MNIVNQITADYRISDRKHETPIVSKKHKAGIREIDFLKTF